MKICTSLSAELFSDAKTWLNSIDSDLLVRFAIKLLEDVVFFVADVINSGQPVLDIVMGKANRERQKLMREQNILKQV